LGSKNGSKAAVDSPSRSAAIIFPAAPSKKITRQRSAAAKLRSWRVIIMRSKGENIRTVEAPNRERAEAVAVKEFGLDADQRSRLLIRERL